MSVEADVHEVTVHHNAIPGFMDAMTMPYIVKDDVELAKLKPGDQFTADLVVDRANGRAWLQRIQVTNAGNGARPPSPAKLVLPNFGKEAPAFRLIGQDGREIKSSDFSNRALLISFVVQSLVRGKPFSRQSRMPPSMDSTLV